MLQAYSAARITVEIESLLLNQKITAEPYMPSLVAIDQVEPTAE